MSNNNVIKICIELNAEKFEDLTNEQILYKVGEAINSGSQSVLKEYIDLHVRGKKEWMSEDAYEILKSSYEGRSALLKEVSDNITLINQ